MVLLGGKTRLVGYGFLSGSGGLDDNGYNLFNFDWGLFYLKFSFKSKKNITILRWNHEQLGSIY